MKKCARCGQVKPLDQFHRQAKSKDGRQSWCKQCSKAAYGAYYAANGPTLNQRRMEKHRQDYAADPDSFADRRLRRTYAISLADYDAKLAAQGGACALCGAPPKGARLHVDHDHAHCPGNKSCGRCVRDLLCSGCNNGTGIVDDPDLLRKRADYVERWRLTLAPTVEIVQGAPDRR